MSLVTRPRLIGLGLAGVVFLTDQGLKWLVTGPLGLRLDGQQITLLPVFGLTRTSNYGVSLGLLTADSMEMRWGLVALTAAIAAVVLAWLLREKQMADIVPLGMVLGGALGNILDRVRLGSVIDYADLHFGTFRPFLVFNLADAAITLGVVFILARSLLIREKPDSDDAAQRPTEK